MSRLREALGAVVRWSLQHPLGRSQWIALGVWLVLLSCGMLALGQYVAFTTNRDVELYDQGAYLMLAEKNRDALWPAATDGTRNPLFPWLIAKMASGEQAAVFAGALKLNVRLGALVAILLGAWAGRRLAWLPAVMFVTLGGLGILLPISTYVGTEVLFYGLFFAAWMLALVLFDRLTLVRCALFGAVLGIAYLAKPGVTLLCGAFIAVGLVRWLRKGDGWLGVRPLLGALVALVVAGAMMLPRMIDSAQKFNDPLQNTAANCFWEENWNACLPKLAFLNARQRHKIPPDEWPSAKRYLARNGFGGAWARLTNGMAEQCGNVFSVDPKAVWFSREPSAKRPVRRIFPYRGFFLLPPLLIAAGLGVVVVRRQGIGAISAVAWYQLAFVLLLTGASFGAFSWYYVIAPGARFILALYLPVLASSLVAAEALRKKLATGWADAVCAGTWTVILVGFVWHIAIIATHPVFEKVRGAF